VLLYGHFQIQPNKLRQVTLGIGIFRAEYWSDFIHPLKVSRNGHLFGELWRLCEVRVALKMAFHIKALVCKVEITDL